MENKSVVVLYSNLVSPPLEIIIIQNGDTKGLALHQVCRKSLQG
jgi:hypothetical protein